MKYVDIYNKKKYYSTIRTKQGKLEQEDYVVSLKGTEGQSNQFGHDSPGRHIGCHLAFDLMTYVQAKAENMDFESR